MPIKTRRVLLELYRKRYHECVKKSEKTLVLNEFTKTFKYRADRSYSRKYSIKILRGQIEPRMNRPGPKAKYTDVVVIHLVKLWESMNRMCSKKMVVAIPLWLPFYKDADVATQALLLSISSSTIDRLLRPHKTVIEKGLSTTKSAFIKSKVPIKLLDGDVLAPGYIEADTVAHCGDTIQGHYVNTLTATDLYSGWTENRALWSKSSAEVIAKLTEIERGLPFLMTAFACDSGTEFINHDLHDYLQKRDFKIDFHRRRPYKKNDNAHVEQKNHTHVREIFGYRRFDYKELQHLMNEIYRAYWNPIWNYFTPVMKLKKKTRIGGRIKKEYDDPKTPYQRLIESDQLQSNFKRKLNQELKMKNPFYLKQELDRKLKQFFSILDMYEKEKKLTGS